MDIPSCEKKAGKYLNFGNYIQSNFIKLITEQSEIEWKQMIKCILSSEKRSKTHDIRSKWCWMITSKSKNETTENCKRITTIHLRTSQLPIEYPFLPSKTFSLICCEHKRRKTHKKKTRQLLTQETKTENLLRTCWDTSCVRTWTSFKKSSICSCVRTEHTLETWLAADVRTSASESLQSVTKSGFRS